jgi:hypothetical protein
VAQFWYTSASCAKMIFPLEIEMTSQSLIFLIEILHLDKSNFKTIWYGSNNLARASSIASHWSYLSPATIRAHQCPSSLLWCLLVPPVACHHCRGDIPDVSSIAISVVKPLMSNPKSLHLSQFLGFFLGEL